METSATWKSPSLAAAEVVVGMGFGFAMDEVLAADEAGFGVDLADDVWWAVEWEDLGVAVAVAAPAQEAGTVAEAGPDWIGLQPGIEAAPEEVALM